MLRSVAIVLLTLAVLLGQGALLPSAAPCPRCAEHCPMKKPRLPCHSNGSQMPCHGGDRIASASCGHHTVSPTLTRDVALLAPPLGPRATEVASRFVTLSAMQPSAPTLEPPIDPPRFSFAV